ncbi:unnamed protein product [Microthlaspi erraticum]|uniref:Uncharacterized protein n=1 Tax=Microthlaspi erraticum TaxID=1685480 RepID=A0A6D2HQS1_9BRAS|nr:unnamed protein product [Microthlaspi erraticum]
MRIVTDYESFEEHHDASAPSNESTRSTHLRLTSHLGIGRNEKERAKLHMAKETPSRSRLDHFVKEVSIRSYKCSQTSPEA